MIPVNRPLLDGNEKKYLNECIDTGWISSEGPFVERLENHFETFTGRKYGFAVCNGSAALDLALSVLDLAEGDEVILPSFTIISCLQAVLRCGATPILVDCDPFSWNMSINNISCSITSRTRAILIVHIYGLCSDISPIIELAKHHNLYVVEDAAEAHGLKYKDSFCGSFGDISTFSFYPNKLVTTGEGGLILTNNYDLASKIRLRRNLAFSPHKRFVHDEFGWNMRMSNLQAAVGCAQFEQIERFIQKKIQIGKIYTKLFENLEGVSLPLDSTDYAQNIYWVYGIVLEKKFPISAQEFMEKLSSRGIGTRPFFWPLHKQPVANRMGLFNNVSLPASEHLGSHGFYIPSGLGLSNLEIEKSAEAVIEVARAV